MKKIVITMILVTKVYAAELGYEGCYLEEAEKSRCEVKLVFGKKEGKEICRALDNPDTILLEAQYSNGELNGPFVCREFTNQVVIEAQYSDGRLVGEHRDYSTGRSWRDVKEAWSVKYFDRGKQIGMEFFANKEGKILDFMPNCWEQGEFGSNYGYCAGLNYGKYDAQVKSFVNAEIKKRFKEMNREIVTKFDNGKVRFKAKMVDGRYDGEVLHFYEDGTQQTKSIYKAGDPIQIEEFFESGKLKVTKTYKNGKLEKSESYYENGKLSELLKVSFDDLKRREQVERFDDKGYRESEYAEIYYSNSWWGQRDGPYRLYGPKGKLSYEAKYKMGKLDGKATYSYEDYKEDELWDNGWLKESVKYDKVTGKPAEKIEYMKDGSEKSRTKLNPPST
jgi:antitoxin component YwqK of YwqJK toxin-antitoxin module